MKFDVEGAEWGCLASASTEELSTFAVITGEFHGLNLLGEDAFFNRAASVLELILRTHVPTHVHANNAAPLTLVRGIPMPWLLEVSFLRRDLCSFAPAHGGIPGLLDRPNALADDIVLSAWSHASTAADDSLGFQALQSEALDRSMAALTDAVLERDAAIQEREAVMQEAADLREALAASRAEGEQLHEALVEAYELHEKAIASRDEAVREYMSLRASRSWRYTSWMRRD